MRAVVLILLVTGISAFKPGHEYVFRYETQVLTGIPTMNAQYSGVKIIATARTQIKMGFKVICKLENVEIHQMNREAPGIVANEPVPNDLFTRLSPEHSRVIIEQLIKPFFFRYTGGYVTSIMVSASEPAWCINLKRGIMNLFQIDLTQQNPIHDSNHQIEEILMNNNIELNGPIESAYRVMEPGITGECESIYVNVPGTEMKVTKVRNFHNCKTKPIWEEGLFSNIGVLPMFLHKTRNVIQSTSMCDYTITGNLNHFLIRKAVLTGNYIFSPLNKAKEDSIVTDIVQVLELETTRKIGNTINPVGSMIPLRGGLIMRAPNSNYHPGTRGNSGEYSEFNNYSGYKERSLEQSRSGENYRRESRSWENYRRDSRSWENYSSGSQEFYSGSNERSMKKSPYGEYYTGESMIQVVEPLLERILRDVNPIVTPEAPTLITNLVLLLRQGTSQEIESVLNTYVIKMAGTPEIIKKRELILDILPMLPHPEIVPMISRLIKERIITPFRGAYMINLIALTMPPTQEVITNLLRIIRDPSVRENSQVFGSLILSIGAFSNKLAVRNRKLAFRTSIKPTVQKIRPVLEKLLASDVNEEKVLGLKAIGNAGLPELLPVVVPMIRDTNLPIIIRTQAIYACRKVAPFVRSRIQTLLLPIFMNKMEPPEVRIACFLIIMDSRPYYSTIQTIAHQLNNETSMQVESFVYSYIHTLSTVTHPSLLPVVKMVRNILRITKPIQTGLLYSKAAVLDLYSDSLDLGALAKVNIINSPRSLLPEVLNAQLTTHFFGKPIEAAEIGIEARGFSSVIRNILGPNSVVSDIISGKARINDIFLPSRTAEWGQITEEIKKMMSKINLPGEGKIAPEKELLSIYIKLLGNELRFGNLDILQIGSLMDAGEMKIEQIDRIVREGYRVNLLKSLPLVDNAIVIPTPAGIPLTLNLTAVPVFNIDGFVKVQGLKSLAHLITGPIPEEVQVVLDVSPSVAVQVTGTIGVDLTVVKSGAGLNAMARAQMPVKVEATINTKSLTIEKAWHVSKQEVKVLSVSLQHSTFIATTPLVPSPNVMDVTEKEINNPLVYAIPILKPIVCPLLGLEFVVDGIVTLGAAGWSPVFPLAGKQKFDVIIKPTSQTPSQIKTTISYGRISERKPANTFGLWSWLSWGSAFNKPNHRPITPFRAITTPITKKIFVTIEGVGGGPQQICHSQITWIHSPMYKKNHLNIQIITAPLISLIGGTWKMMTDVAVDLTKIIKYPRTRTRAPETVCKISVTYGRNTFQDSAIIMKVVTGEKGFPLRAVFPSVPQMTVTPTVYTLSSTIEYRNISIAVLPPVMMVVEAVKMKLFPWVTTLVTATPIATDKINIVCRVIPSLAKVTAAVITPLNINYIIDIPLTSPLLTYAANVISPYPMKISMPGNYPYNSITRMYPCILYGECKLNNKNLNTFDGVTVNLPSMPETCEVILARDCSPEGLFTLITTSHTMQPKTITLMIPKNKIQIKPSSGQLNVIVNGSPKSINSGTPVVIRQDETSGLVMAEVHLQNGKIAVNCTKFGITVITDGTKIVTRVHPSFKGQTCGLCGNFDGEKSIEHTIKTISGRIPQNPENYITRYIIPSNSCPANIITSVVPKGTCNKVRRNIVTNKNVNGVNNKCFTINPVQICSTSCRPTRNNTESLPVHCMPINNATIRLEEECKSGVVYALASKPVTTVVPINVPEKCVPVY